VPIITPSLDDRRFDDLVEELIARIPAHTPEWTNPRLGDPGRTLIELFAWLTDTMLYRANLVPERQRLVFLRMLGQTLRPARAAGGIVSLAYAKEDLLEANRLLPGARVAGPVPFETLSDVTVLPITCEAYYKRRLAQSESARMADVLQGLASIHGLNGAPRGYATTPLFDEGRAVPTGIDVFTGSADRALWLALLAPKAPQESQQPAFNEAARQALGGGDTGLPELLSIGVVPTLKLPDLFEDVGPRAKVPVIWEITTRGRSAHETDYLTLTPVPNGDTTHDLTQAGVLRLPLPDESLLWAPSNDVLQNPRAGVGDAPPRLDDVEKASRLLAWIRLRPSPAQKDLKLDLSWIGINAVQVEQRVVQSGRVLGVSNGAADQVFRLPGTSVDAATLQIDVEEPGRGYARWARVEDLAAISADTQIARSASAYELDAEAGTLRFGDGIRGRVPERQMRVRLASGRFGGGRSGNLPAGSLKELSGQRVEGGRAPAIKVHQPLPTEGGEDAETLVQAERRIPAMLRHRERAVTADDYRRLAYESPGLNVGRVELMPGFKPRDRRSGVAGVVTVMALPAQALGPAPNPRPDRPFIENLHAHLSVRVPLTTELYVIGCEYIALGLSVAVSIRDGFGRDQVLFDVRQALRRLLWSLPPGGNEGQGWPLGREVRERELEVEISRVPGVRTVNGIHLFERARLPQGDDWRMLPLGADQAHTLRLQPWQLPELLSVVVVEVDPETGTGPYGRGAPDNLRALPNPFADAQSVAVPVVPEVC
jgi:predicted phage baseplate assembly protein